MEAFRLPDARTLGAPVPPRNLADLERVAKEQFGLLTRGQCLGAGMSDDAIKWRVRRGWWVTVNPGVYLTVPGRDDWCLRALAAQLAIDDAAWSHATAAFVHGLIRTPSRTVDLLVGHEQRVSTPPGVLVHRRRGDVNRSVDKLHWPWRTTVEDTILDICASTSVDETFALLGRAFQRRLTSEAALRGHLSFRTRHPRRQLLELVLSDVADGAESAMELRFLRDVERAHGLPHGLRQLSVHPDGRQIHDVGYVEQRVLVELDGRLGHEGPAARIQDGMRDRRGATSGWLMMRAFWRDVAGFPCDLAVET